MTTRLNLDTVLVHAGGEADTATGAVAPPIHLATTFEHGPDGDRLHGHLYVRESNPTQSRLEEALAAAEGGDAALFFASGLAAAAALLQTLPAGATLLIPRDAYHGVREMATTFLPRWGGRMEAVDMTDLAAVELALMGLSPGSLVWVETPSNPQLQIVDIAAVASLAHRHGAEIVVDSTFASPVVQRPLELGADVVMHSATKYMGGHSDVQGGGLILRQASERHRELLHVRKILGAVASPFNAWLVLRGLRSLACRMERHCASALTVARRLAAHPAVERVFYPGLPDHPGHDIARRQMKAFGGVVSFCVRGEDGGGDGGKSAAIETASRVRLFTNATSLGGVESLIEHRASVEGPDSPTARNLLRASIGLEHPDDLVADLEQALER